MNTSADVMGMAVPQFWPRSLPPRLEVPATSLWFNLEVSATRYPEKAAYIFFGNPLNYSELRDQALALAGWLESAGVKKGDRVLVQMQNCPQFIVAFYAILRAGAVVVPVSAMNTSQELQHYLADAQVAAAICGAELAASLRSAIDDAQAPVPNAVLVTRYADALPNSDESHVPSEVRAVLLAEHELPAGCTRWSEAVEWRIPPRQLDSDPDDIALLLYTSGTTGRPKGCIHTHATLMPNALAGAMWTEMSASSRSLSALPMYHVTGLIFGVLSNVYIGATSVLMYRWNREYAGRWINEYGITNFACIPTMIVDMLASPNYKNFGLQSLCNLVGGGSAMPQAIAERLKQEFNIDFAEGYGLTETAALVLMNPLERPKLQCLGIPIFGNDIRIIDSESNTELAQGESGEIVVSGATVFQGYWRQPTETARAFVAIDRKLFFRTGDIGYKDPDGYFYISDRLKRMINASGFKVWPAEVEAQLYRHPSIQEACVIGVPDEYRGETVCAVIVTRANAGELTQDEISEWARGYMAAYKVPKVVKFVSELPKTASGKISWRDVQAKYKDEIFS